MIIIIDFFLHLFNIINNIPIIDYIKLFAMYVFFIIIIIMNCILINIIINNNVMV